MFAALKASHINPRLCAFRNVSARSLSSTAPKKPTAAQLVKQLREIIDGLSISKAREALAASEDDINKAIDWLSKDMAIAGAQKAARSTGRKTSEGLVGISVLSRGTAAQPGQGGLRAAMVELNCETDFVARNDLFVNLLEDIAHTTAFLAEHKGRGDSIAPVDVESLDSAPLISSRAPADTPTHSVGDSIRETIAKTGELIVLRRAVAVVQPAIPPVISELALRLSSYAHGGTRPTLGRTASLVLIGLRSPNLSTLLSKESFATDLERVERSLARQIVGFSPITIRASEDGQDESALYDQPFGMLAGTPTDLKVGVFLQRWALEHNLISEKTEEGGLSVLEMLRWRVGGA